MEEKPIIFDKDLRGFWFRAKYRVWELLFDHERTIQRLESEVVMLRKELHDLRAEYDGHIDEHMEFL